MKPFTVKRESLHATANTAARPVVQGGGRDNLDARGPAETRKPESALLVEGDGDHGTAGGTESAVVIVARQNLSRGGFDDEHAMFLGAEGERAVSQRAAAGDAIVDEKRADLV